MTDELVSFEIDGSEERRGAIPADAFLAKLRAFITAVYAFERAFSKKEKRQTELEIVDLSRRSPGKVAMRVRTLAPGFPAQEAMAWTFEQFDRIYAGRPVDPAVPQTAIDTVVDLAAVRTARLPQLGLMRASFGQTVISIDKVLEARALAARAALVADDRPPWRPGVSRGSLFGELRGVMDFDGERQFFILPPSGPSRVQCVFTEDLRARVGDNLFKTVRAAGFLHYDGNSPYPVLLEATTLESVPEPASHLSDIRGIFRDMEPPPPLEDWA
ncbi:hypothetical protein [Phenylobacterium sp.]|uniref:hypothetical protein n=1 Tax=Phenylobacterium sp. TaxID=1871053 RepID=UPI002B898649|nr:hypothetical protein [Phenylobacterium sp.]HVI32061.1 hypothetical protein [Phenylobacterium sp.]